MTFSLASTLPEHSNDGYVAAAYIVFFALVLIYVAIMSIRLGRVERKVERLREDAQNLPSPPGARGTALLEDPRGPSDSLSSGEHTPQSASTPQAGAHPEEHRQPSETV